MKKPKYFYGVQLRNKEPISDKMLSDLENKLKIKFMTIPKHKSDSCTIKCSAGHEIRLGFNRVCGSFVCFECVANEFPMEINQNIIRYIFEKFSGELFPAAPSFAVNPITNRELMVHGYSEKLSIAFRIISPQESSYNKKFHRNMSEFDKIRARLECIINHCKTKKIDYIQIPYYMKIEDIIVLAKNKFGDHSLSKEDFIIIDSMKRKKSDTSTDFVKDRDMSSDKNSIDTKKLILSVYTNILGREFQAPNTSVLQAPNSLVLQDYDKYSPMPPKDICYKILMDEMKDEKFATFQSERFNKANNIF